MTTISTSHAHPVNDASEDFDPAIVRDSHRMWLGGLPPMITEYAVLQLIRQFGTLTDFHFPVHRTGDARGSTVGYCFVAYDTAETAKKALKALNGLKFHGHILIARPARRTQEELSLLQRANEEAARLRLVEEMRLREAELAARLQQTGVVEHTGETDIPILPSKPYIEFNNPGTSEQATFPSFARSSDTSGKFGYITSGGMSRLQGCASKVPKNSAGCKLSIQKIESALRRLENSPIGGSALLQPASATQRSLVPAGILAKHSTPSNASFARGRPPAVRNSSGFRRFGIRSHSRRL